ncbi:MAG: Fe-S protein assembly co-chaperone HscB [Burkholderia sp.]|nr:Fe-S protein assembly co-chaperone HscB [Burkholderia sp.]
MIFLKETYFDLFHLPEHFDIDMHKLNTAYQTIQKQVHPDRFVASSDMQKRISMQWTSHTNEAYRTLYDPLNRAIYMLNLHGIVISAKTKMAMEPSFLAQQMEWYNTIENLCCNSDIGALTELLAELKNEERIRLSKIGALLNSNEYQSASKEVRQMIFVNRVILDAKSKIWRL